MLYLRLNRADRLPRDSFPVEDVKLRSRNGAHLFFTTFTRVREPVTRRHL